MTAPEHVPATEAATAAWDAYTTDPITVDAQSIYTARQAELAPLRQFYNDELTRARLRFQEMTHTPMLALTLVLQALDDAEPPAITE
jgi:hypothetical protein